MAEQKTSQELNEQLREKTARKIIGLADRGEITLTAVERILQEYDAAKQS